MKRVLVLSGLCCLAAWVFAPAAIAAERAEYPLKEVSAFSVKGEAQPTLVMGQREEISTTADAAVVKYPAFESTEPLYGTFKVGRDYLNAEAGVAYRFALDESKGSGKGYDKLYIDLNRDLDLTNDAPDGVMPSPPSNSSPNWSDTKMVVFSYVDLPIDLGERLGVTSIRLMPRLTIAKGGYRLMWFVNTTARSGEVSVGGQKRSVTIAQAGVTTGRYDKPGTYMAFEGWRESWFGADTLRGMRQVDGKWYRFGASPPGDKFYVEEYDGDLGVLQVSAGGRDIKDVGISGAIESEGAAVPVGDWESGGMPGKHEARFTLPVGDYLPTYLTINLGRLSMQVSQNYHSDGMPRERGGRPPVYAIHICEDEPFTMDFSATPEVMFASPKKLQRYKPGDTVDVKAVLTDPSLDMMIRGLSDTSVQEQATGNLGNETISYSRSKSLDPTVTIRDSQNLIVASGKMPFG
jgi:hypothetical protein